MICEMTTDSRILRVEAGIENKYFSDLGKRLGHKVEYFCVVKSCSPSVLYTTRDIYTVSIYISDITHK